ncbi:DNA-binding protein [Intestinimonas massiliensis]|jgi:predicted DNA-binding protein with PD1-like motif|uniref:DNA-binding protein n=1 Tax=Intestinimonas massiliensis (ex Afouda et al. 2020) TaxID=1673721 RepID=A0ABS9MCR1_9FIRM|nr:PPC domain-containing DNA-binding protein [Intestinimonas massiliensis (ex Afouda et al. 2020)]MCG4528261.1 DNA-binding protein [Intestinimonas massiliensis (ex Afouda et al. 2020)]MCQ4806859.1 DNA-binding protein [Intestinimonas massiliensis (ex Afouda et al. 2020)]
MKTHVFRLRRGSDLLKALQEYARTRRIAAGTVVSGVGCVTRARVRDASGVTVRELNEPLEIVSLMGTLSTARTHLHIALAREDLTVLGGHLMEGCIVNTTAEVVLLELDGVRFGAERDGETGYDELAILSLEERA